MTALYFVDGEPTFCPDLEQYAEPACIPELPLITTRAVKLNPDLWPDLEEA